MTQAVVPSSSSENISFYIRSFLSCISNQNIIPVIPSTMFLNSEPRGSDFLMTKDRLGNHPVFVVL